MANGTNAAEAKLALLESLLTARDSAECARQAVQWLANQTTIPQAACLVVDSEQRCLTALAGYGLAIDEIASFSIELEEQEQPLVAALARREPTVFQPANGRGSTAGPALSPLGAVPFQALPLGASRLNNGLAVGLLLVAATARVDARTRWLVEALGQKLDQLRVRALLIEAERQFGRERTLLYNIINNVTDPILLTDIEGRVVIANARAEALFVAGEDESEGRRGAVRLNNMLLSSALATAGIVETKPITRELLLVDPIDGSDLLFELLTTMTEDPHEGTGLVSVLRNVTDLRRASEEIEENYRKMRIAEAEARAERDRLNLVIGSVADPILVTDPNGDISLMNAPAERLFTELPHGDQASLRFVQANDAHFSSFLSGLLFSSDRRRRGELGLVEPSTGQPLPVEAISGKILSEQGELTAVVTILHDRTEAIEKQHLYDRLKKGSEELERKIQEATADIAQQNELLRRQAIALEQASALKSQFLANMSHEFRTPLNAILGYTNMVLQGVSGELKPQQRRHLTRIDSNGRHLLAIINEILDIARIEAGRMPLQVSRFRLADLIAEVLAELEPIIARSKNTVSTHIAGNLPALRSDRQKVKQIVLNLLTNALKFTHEGHVQITAQRSRLEKVIEISVEDTGIGIAEADLERIFEDFRQLDNSPSRAYSGTGLGLSICRRLAAMLGGTISLKSKPDEGSTFTLRMPARTRT
jgi:signal transduction histidine kinase